MNFSRPNNWRIEKKISTSIINFKFFLHNFVTTKNHLKVADASRERIFLVWKTRVNRESFQNQASLHGAFRSPKRGVVFDHVSLDPSTHSLCPFFRTKSGANTGRPSRTDRMNPSYETRLVRF